LIVALRTRTTTAHDRERMDDLVLAARLQPFPRLAAGLGREIETVRRESAERRMEMAPRSTPR
jgi:hypothetical protein